MLLAVDIGNTNIVLGVYRGAEQVAQWRITTEAHRMSDEHAIVLRNLFEFRGLRFDQVTGVVLGSGVPPLTVTFEELSRRYLHCEPLVVGPGVKTGVRILYENPREVGADRIANALAVHRLYGGPAIVVDFGTATTFDAVAANGDYLGGAIAPGITIAAEALFQRASRLWRVELARPRTAIGRNTVGAMQAGILFGYVGLVEGLVARFQAEMGPARVIATGGLADVIARETSIVEVVDQRLTLEGLRLIYELNRTGDADDGATG
ncbi:MAG: type III pantothenate kinase [Chloroflexi bacterium]|nr:type III pantothenate kinase [Chloroflexota bacterium]